MEVARAGADRGIQPRHGFQVVVEDVGPGVATTISTAPGLRRKSGVRTSIVVPGAAARMARMMAAKWPAPPSGRSSRSTEVMTTCAQAELRHGIGDAGGFVGVERGRAGRCATLQNAQARVQVSPMIIMVAWRWRPALADVGAGGFLADRDQAVVAHQGAGLVVDRMGGRLDPDPGGLALDRVVRPVRLLRMAQGRGAVVDDEAGGHGG